MIDHQHTHCQDLLGSLSDYVDGSLGETICQEIETHLAGCNNCRIVVDTLRKTITLYKDVSDELDVPQEVRQRLYRILHLEDLMKQ